MILNTNYISDLCFRNMSPDPLGPRAISRRSIPGVTGNYPHPSQGTAVIYKGPRLPAICNSCIRLHSSTTCVSSALYWRLYWLRSPRSARPRGLLAIPSLPRHSAATKARRVHVSLLVDTSILRVSLALSASLPPMELVRA
jgi:hypothetical protein